MPTAAKSDLGSLRVLMTGDCVGGVFQYCVGLAGALQRQGIEVGLAIMGPPPSPDQQRILAACEGLSVYQGAFALEWMDEPWREVDEAGRWLLEIAAEFGPDVVHLNGYCHARLDFGVPVLVAAHSCVLSWWRSVFGQAAPERYAEYKRRVSLGLASAQAIVAPTMAMLAALSREYQFSTPALVIPDGVDLRRPALREKESLFFAAGRVWDRAKNLGLLAEAASALPWPVYIAGEGSLPGAGARSENVELLGSLSHASARAWMERASVFVHPACYEPFGLAVLEAALAGCALLLGDIPSLREVWGREALFFPPDDRAALIDAARRLAEDRELRDRLAQGASRRAYRYSVRSCAQGYAEVYSALVRRVGGRGTPRDAGQAGSLS